MDDIVVEPDSSLVIKVAFICLQFSLSLSVEDISLDIIFQIFFNTESLLHFFLMCIFSGKDNAVIYIFISLHLFPPTLSTFNIFLFMHFHCFIDNSIKMCLGLVLLTFPMIGSYWPPWISGFIVLWESGTCLAIIPSNILYICMYILIYF